LGSLLEGRTFIDIYRLLWVPCMDAPMSWSHGCEWTTFVCPYTAPRQVIDKHEAMVFSTLASTH